MKNPADYIALPGLRNGLLALLLVLGTVASAQDANPFLERSFWKSDPDVAAVQLKIVEGNDPAAMTSAAFDGVIYSMLEGANPAATIYLLEQKGNAIEKKTHDSRTYIHWAAFAGNTEIMEWLLERKCRTDVKDSHGYTPAAFAASTGQRNTKVYDLFAKYGVDLADEHSEGGANLLLLNAPYAQKAADLKYFTSKGMPLTSTDDAGNGVFNYASIAGNVSLLKELVAAGVPYAGVNAEGGNAFLFAARGTRGQRNAIEVYQYLDGLGLDAAAVSNDGNSAFHRVAASDRDAALIQFFLDKGAKVNQPDASGNTPFLNASRSNTLQVVAMLSDAGAEVGKANKEGISPLMAATQSNSPEVVGYLLGQGADAGSRDAAGNSLSYYLLEGYNAQNPDVFDAKLDLLSDKGFDLNEVQAAGNTLYHLAATDNNLELLKRVKSDAIPVNARNDEGLTALHIAAMKATDGALLKYLLDLGADKGLRTEFDETALDLARENELLQGSHAALAFLNE